MNHSQARVGGMLSGKCGLVYCHMRAAREGLQPLMDAMAMSDVPVTQFLSTHVERTPELIDGAKWIKAGGRVNLTCRTEEVLCSPPSLSGPSAWTAHSPVIWYPSLKGSIPFGAMHTVTCLWTGSQSTYSISVSVCASYLQNLAY